MSTRGTGYYCQALQRLSADIQALAYQLGHAEQRASEGEMSAVELHNMAGSAARLRSQAEHCLSQVERLCYACENVAPKDHPT